MSTNRPNYDAGGSTPQTVQAFRNRACALPFAHPDYSPPSPAEVSALIGLLGWSQSQVAKVTGVAFKPGKGSSTIRKWQAAEGDPNYRQIPYAAFRLLLLHAGVVSIEEEVASIYEPGCEAHGSPGRRDGVPLYRYSQLTRIILQENQGKEPRLCECKCGRIVVGNSNYFSASCKKRVERERKKQGM